MKYANGKRDTIPLICRSYCISLKKKPRESSEKQKQIKTKHPSGLVREFGCIQDEYIKINLRLFSNIGYYKKLNIIPSLIR